MLKSQLENEIKNKLEQAFHPIFMQLENESHHHHKATGDHSHYKLTLVSDVFENMPLIACHRLVYQILADELAQTIHALALHLYTEETWLASEKKSPDSPDCRGGFLQDKHN